MMSNIIRFMMVLVASSLLFLGTNNKVEAAIYKCIDADGKTYYNDKVCPKNAKQTEIDNVKDPVGGYIPPAFTKEAKEKRSKGVVAEGQQNNSDNKSSQKEISGDSNSSSGNNSSNSTNETNSNENSGNTEEVSELDRIEADAKNGYVLQNTKPLPTIPLKVNNNTKEASRLFTR